MGLVSNSKLLNTDEDVKEFLVDIDKEVALITVFYATLLDESRIKNELFRRFIMDNEGYNKNSFLEFNKVSGNRLPNLVSEQKIELRNLIFLKGSYAEYIPRDGSKLVESYLKNIGKINGGRINLLDLCDMGYKTLSESILYFNVTEKMTLEFLKGFYEVELEIFFSKRYYSRTTRSLALKYNVSSSRIGQIYNQTTSKMYKRFVELREQDEQWRNII